LGARDRSLLDELELATAIESPTESGRAREQAWSAFIAPLLGTSHSISPSPGIVFDVHGEKSRQMDLVIYRSDYAPVFPISGVPHFLIESVAAAFEVRAAIDSKSDLESALANIYSVKALDRTGGGNNYVLHGNVYGGLVSAEKFSHQVFAGILTGASLEQQLFISTLGAYFARNDRRLWPNIYVDAAAFAAVFEPPATGSGGDSMTATSMRLARRPPPPSTYLAHALVDYLRVAELIDYESWEYFFGRVSETGTRVDLAALIAEARPDKTSDPEASTEPGT
jgi:hypothetical protein